MTLMARRIDEMMLEPMPSASVPEPWTGVEEWLAAARSKYSVLRDCAAVVPTGSVLHGTATTASSGVDLILLEKAGAAQPRDPTLRLESIRSRIGSAATTAVTGIAVTVEDRALGKMSFIPGVVDGANNLRVPDRRGNRWRAAIPEAHAAAMKELAELCRGVIRFVKHCDALAPLEGFHIEAIGIEALRSDTPLHFHWKIKDFFDTAVESVSEGRGHPLAPQRVRFDYLAGSQRQSVLKELARIQEAANNAWFLVSLEETVDDEQEARESYLSAVGSYAAILDPTLGS